MCLVSEGWSGVKELSNGRVRAPDIGDSHATNSRRTGSAGG